MTIGLLFCERCGGVFLPSGVRVKVAAVAQGPLLDVVDSVCISCRKSDEHFDPRSGEIVTTDELRRRQGR